MNLLLDEEIEALLKGCVLNERLSQKKIYSSFYGYGMSICQRYSSSQEDALEILNDSFLKVFIEIYRFKPSYSNTYNSFKGWFRKIVIYTAIDHFRKTQRQKLIEELDESHNHLPIEQEDALGKLSNKELMAAVKCLTPAYRTVFNLFIIEGFSHDEIGGMLNISSGTSKSNVAKARKQLQKILEQKIKITASDVV